MLNDGRSIPCEMIFSATEFTKMQHGYNESGRDQDLKWRLVFDNQSLKIIRAGSDTVSYAIDFIFANNYYRSHQAKLFLTDLANDNYHRQTILYLIRKHLLSESVDYLLSPIFGTKLILDSGSIHGIAHWQRVALVGNLLAGQTGADQQIVNLFAFCHDLGRRVDYEDPGHGQRSVELLKSQLSALDLGLSEESYSILLEAIANHSITDHQTSDITIQTCLDADRLDLWRVGLTPDPAYLYTEPAKSQEFIYFLKNLA